MHKIITIVLCSLVTLSLPACNFEQAKEQLEQRLKVKGHIAPTIAELNLNLPIIPDGLVGKTATTYVSPLKYTTKKSDTIYFYDKDGNLIDKPAPDGYHRHILGVTDDGRTVVQDFYANNTPQTAILALKQGADESSFDSHINDSDTIWFDKKGNITQIAMHGSDWIVALKDGKPAVYIRDTKAQTIIVVNYPDTQNVMSYLEKSTTTKEETLVHFYKNGQALLKFTQNADEKQEAFAWDENGKSINPKKRQNDIEQIGNESQKIINEVANNMG